METAKWLNKRRATKNITSSVPVTEEVVLPDGSTMEIPAGRLNPRAAVRRQWGATLRDFPWREQFKFSNQSHASLKSMGGFIGAQLLGQLAQQTTNPWASALSQAATHGFGTAFALQQMGMGNIATGIGGIGAAGIAGWADWKKRQADDLLEASGFVERNRAVVSRLLAQSQEMQRGRSLYFSSLETRNRHSGYTETMNRYSTALEDVALDDPRRRALLREQLLELNWSHGAATFKRDDLKRQLEQARSTWEGMESVESFTRQRRRYINGLSAWLLHNPNDQRAKDNMERAQNDIASYQEEWNDAAKKVRELESLFGEVDALAQTIGRSVQTVERELQKAKVAAESTANQAYEWEYQGMEDAAVADYLANLGAKEDAQAWGETWAARGRQNRVEERANGILANRRYSPRRQFSLLAAELDSYRASRNGALREAFELNQQILRGGSSEQLEDWLQQRSAAETKAGNFANIISVIESALQRIDTQVTRPDMNNVQGLAQYGMFFNERDNRTRIYETYLQKQVNLQTEIRDKLNEGVANEATYN